MRVERLDLSAYGHFAETKIDLSESRQGLTVIWGLNEAGKSTARRALLAAMFGFQRNDPDAHRFGRHGLRVGACLSAADGTEFSFVRQGLSNVLGEDGTAIDEDAVERFCDVGRDLYTRLFSIGHDELRSGSESLLDADGDIGRLVYGASLGAGSVAAVLRRLDERADRLFQERKRVQQIPKALDAYRAGMQAAKAARVRSRDWDRLSQAVEDATAQLTQVRTDFEGARAEQVRLERIRSARPLVARRADIAKRLGELGTVASEDWAARTTDALGRYREARADVETALATRGRLASEVSAIEVPVGLLERADPIDELVEGIGRYRKDTADLPNRRTELEAALERLADQLRILGETSDDGRIVAETDLVAVEALARRHVELEAGGRTALDELRRARESIKAAGVRLSAIAEPPDVAGLDRVLRLARPKLDVARDLAGDRTSQAAAAEEMAALAGRLGIGSLESGLIEALAVPVPAEIDVERDRQQAHRHLVSQAATERERLENTVKTNEDEIAGLSTELPDPERVDAARGHRDAGWQLVRRTLDGETVETEWAAELPLADAYEGAVVDADLAADERYDQAGTMATLTQLWARIAELDGQRRQLDERDQELLAANAAAAQRWETRWAALGIEARSPEVMAEWLRDQHELVRDIGTWRQREAALHAAQGEIDRQCAALAAALTETGHNPCSEELDLLVAQAEEVVEAAHTLADARNEEATKLQLAEEAEPQRTAALEEHEQVMALWRTEWTTALEPLSLRPTVTPDAATVAVAAHRALAAARNEVSALTRRIEGIEADREAYVEQAAAVAAGMLSVHVDATPLDTVSKLQRRLIAARALNQQHETLSGQLKQVTAGAQEASSLLDEARRALSSLRAEAAMGTSEEEPDSGLDDAVGQALEAASLRQKTDEVEADLLEQGDGRSIDQIVAEAAGAGDTLAGRIESTTTEVDGLATRLEEATTQLADARRALEAVTDAATAADLEQDAQAELALASEFATEYARTSLAAEVLRRTIADYGERHRGPLLNRAAELFCSLTDGAFTELVPDADGDRQVLLAKRRGGELCTIGALSDGTRDALYLALRLAGLEHQLGVVADPPPVVLDDILVHFDDTRAAAAVRALAELGQGAQVLLFTHHERIVDIARQELAPEELAIVRLEPRDHDQPPVSVSGDIVRPTVDSHVGTGTRGGREAAEHEILAAAQAGGRALSKAELLEQSGVAESQWPAAIRSLVDRGALIQEGQKRGKRATGHRSEHVKD